MIKIDYNISASIEQKINININTILELFIESCKETDYFVLQEIFPAFYFRNNKKKCIDIIHTLEEFTIDDYEHILTDVSPIYEYALFNLFVWWLDVTDKGVLCEFVSEDEIKTQDDEYFAKYINDIKEYKSFMFEDLDFLDISAIFKIYIDNPILVKDFLNINLDDYLELMPSDIQEKYELINTENIKYDRGVNMARGMIIGGTDYSNQSIEDMISDLENWILSLKESDDSFKSIMEELEINGYWSSVDFDFKASCYDLRRYFKTAIADLQEVINGINSEIKEYHIKLLRNLGENAHEQHKHHRSVWRQYHNKEYGNTNFKKVETLYGEGSDMAGDMFDIDNLAARLQHFVGRKLDEKSKSAVNVNNNYYSTVTGVQQNYNSENIQQTVNIDSDKKVEVEQIKKLISQFREYLESSTAGEETEEVLENINDLEETINHEEPKKNRIKSFGKSVGIGMKKLLTMKAFNNIEEVSSKLPSMIESLTDTLDKF